VVEAVRHNRPMTNIASVLKDEITRLARKEMRGNTESLKKTVATYRSEIAALKRRVEALEREAKKTAKVVSKVMPEPLEGNTSHRFSAKGFATHRQRLGLSAADYGRLLGVSGLSVYKWEGGQVRPLRAICRRLRPSAQWVRGELLLA
jgi:DNA-binding transcriptional regulator YiaG